MQQLNDDALTFNKKLNDTSQNLVVRFPDLKIVVFGIYDTLLTMINTPGARGNFKGFRLNEINNNIFLFIFHYFSKEKKKQCLKS